MYIPGSTYACLTIKCIGGGVASDAFSLRNASTVMPASSVSCAQVGMASLRCCVAGLFSDSGALDTGEYQNL